MRRFDEAEVLALDRDDPLASSRAAFELPKGVIYLDGNSLGPLTRAARLRVAETVETQWGQGLMGAPTGPATVSGVLQISQATIQDIVYQIILGRLQIPSLGQNFWQNPNPNAVCVSGMGMNLGHYNTYLHSGLVYIYFNGTSQGYGLVF